MNDAIHKLYFELMKRLEGEMEEAFGRLWRRYVCLPVVANHVEIPSLNLTAAGSPQYWRPATDILETEEEFILRLEIAGLSQDLLTISQSLDGKRLWLRGERRDEARSSQAPQWYHQLEIYFGPFELSILLPPGIALDLDEVKASYHQGILFLRISKKRGLEEPKEKRTLSIPIE
ncbi:MAG: Hsp20/alpha crystallin family protein [bacterium]|jgi:HSP20 family molecular chaperone IbpA